MVFSGSSTGGAFGPSPFSGSGFGPSMSSTTPDYLRGAFFSTSGSGGFGAPMSSTTPDFLRAGSGPSTFKFSSAPSFPTPSPSASLGPPPLLAPLAFRGAGEGFSVGITALAPRLPTLPAFTAAGLNGAVGGVGLGLTDAAFNSAPNTYANNAAQAYTMAFLGASHGAAGGLLMGGPPGALLGALGGGTLGLASAGASIFSRPRK